MKDQLNTLNENVGETWSHVHQLRNFLDEILGAEPSNDSMTKAPEKPYNLAFIFDDYNRQHQIANTALAEQLNRLNRFLNGTPGTQAANRLGAADAYR